VTVLVVDDQPPFRAAARALLTRTDGFEHVGDAASAEEAVALVRERAPALVLMDVRLTGRSGVEAVPLVLEAAPGTIVVLCSTYARADLPDGLDDCGAAAFVRKEDLSASLLRELWAAHGR
jgi:DNA-binding NarL/FixJ family response regulator